MSKKDSKADKPEEKIAEGKKASKRADKKKGGNKIDIEAKRLADRAAMDIAASLPAGQGNAFIKLHTEHLKAEDAIAAAQKWKRNVRAEMKAIKVDMDCYNRVNKLGKMDPSDVAAKKATEALYENQLSMPLSDDQKKIIEGINTKRDQAKESLSNLGGGDTGKEIGSSTGLAQSDPAALAEIAGNAPETAANAIPARNDEVGKNFRPHAETAGMTH